MEQATPPEGSRPQEPQTTAALLKEIASLRKQNEEQRRELEQLRGAVPPSLGGSDDSLQPSEMHRFKLFPFEIREMIWEYALPKRLLGIQQIQQKHCVVTRLPVPAIAHVCRESRRFAVSRNHKNALPGEFILPDGEEEGKTPPFQPKYVEPACWTWFSPSNDTLMINPRGFKIECFDENDILVWSAEHIIVEENSFWRGFHEDSIGTSHDIFYTQTTDDLVKHVINWATQAYERPYPDRPCWPPVRGRICNLQTVDFAMREVTKIYRNCPPRVLRRLFGSHNSIGLVDLRDQESASEILRLLGYELSQGMDPDEFFRLTNELAESFAFYQSAADELWEDLRPELLGALARACFDTSEKKSTSGGYAKLPMPFMSDGSGLDMEVAWVKDLSERLTIRPVHVFILMDDAAEDTSDH